MTDPCRPLPAPPLPANGVGPGDATATTPHAPATMEPELPADVARLFRRSLATGRIHPLMPLILHYRQEHPA